MKIKNYISCIAAAGLLLASCKKDLNQNPTGSFSDANAYSTLPDIQLGVNSSYSRLSAYTNDLYINALLSDEAKIGADNAGQGALTYRYQFGADGTTGGDLNGAWYDYYALIDHVNRVLRALPNIKTSSTTEDTRRNVVKGQLLASRAFGHFALLERYASKYNPSSLGVAIMTESNPLAKPARNTSQEVITQIETDLNDAKGLVDPMSTSATFKDTVWNKVNVAGLQARVALYKRDYQKAIDYSTEVINYGVRPLVTGTAFANIWTDANTTAEVLLRLPFATSTGVGGLWTTTTNLIYIAPSDKLVASYATGDIRKAAYIGTSNGNNYVNKWYTSSRGGRVVDLKIMRIAEMYLIRAEAYARLSSPNLSAGTADLNAVRTQRGAATSTPASASDLADQVMTERFKELAFEGFRFFDLKRNSLPVNRLASDANAAWQTLSADNYRFTLPIPRDELTVNPQAVQNPNY